MEDVDLYNAVTKAGDSSWHNRALDECIKRLAELGELQFDDDDTACWYWESSGHRLGEKKNGTNT